MPDDATRDERYEAARQRVQEKKGFFAHAFTFAVINIVFLIVAGTGWLWVTLFWGIGLAFHAYNVFFQHSAWLQGWEARAIEKELHRGQAKPEKPAAAPAAPTPPPAPSTETTQPLTPPDDTKP
jgi:hypothetical protein